MFFKIQDIDLEYAIHASYDMLRHGGISLSTCSSNDRGMIVVMVLVEPLQWKVAPY